MEAEKRAILTAAASEEDSGPSLFTALAVRMSQNSAAPTRNFLRGPPLPERRHFAP